MDGQVSPLKANRRDSENNACVGRGCNGGRVEQHSTGALNQDSERGVYTRTPLQIHGYSFLKGIHLMEINKYLQRTIIQKGNDNNNNEIYKTYS